MFESTVLLINILICLIYLYIIFVNVNYIVIIFVTYVYIFYIDDGNKLLLLLNCNTLYFVL